MLNMLPHSVKSAQKARSRRDPQESRVSSLPNSAQCMVEYMYNLNGSKALWLQPSQGSGAGESENPQQGRCFHCHTTWDRQRMVRERVRGSDTHASSFPGKGQIYEESERPSDGLLSSMPHNMLHDCRLTHEVQAAGCVPRITLQGACGLLESGWHHVCRQIEVLAQVLNTGISQKPARHSICQ